MADGTFPSRDARGGARRLGAAFLLVALFVAACGGPPQPQVRTLGYAAEATSTTSVRVAFDAPVGDGAEDPASYRIDGGGLAVLRAARVGPATVLLGTAPQQSGRPYVLSVSGVAAATGSGTLVTQNAAFSGGAERAPIVASAIALSPTEVLLTFATPTSAQPLDMDDAALDPRYYDVVREGGSPGDATPDLAITSVRFEPLFRSGQEAVILTTAPQEDVGYTIRVTNVTASSGQKLIDPNLNEATFRGIPASDVTSPTVLAATALSNTTVLVEFSEAMLGLDDPIAYAIEGPEGPLAIGAIEVRASQVLLTTAPQRDEETSYTLTVRGVTDRQANPLEPDPTTVTFAGVSRFGPIDGDVTAPRVSNVASTGPHRVLVTFSEPVQGGQDSAENEEHYRIHARLTGALATQAVLEVTDATLRPDRTTVELATRTQSDLEYVLEIVNVKDLAGNQIAAPERGLDPSTMRFTGTSASGALEDEDGDGLSDAAEQKGWIVTVVGANGTSSSSEVTSDPTLPDTDEDGLSDHDELLYRTNPRSGDSDGDGVSDFDELNLYYSEPTAVDTDEDGLQDGLETDFFGTSPIHADTDGDQLEDGYEVEAANRDPRIADVPRLRIEVGDVALTLDERFTYTDAQGTSRSQTSSTGTTLEQGQSRTYATSDTQTMTSSIESTVGAEVSYSFPKDFGATLSASVTVGSSQEYSSTVSQESSASSNRAYNESLEKSSTFESSSEVVREVVDAAVRLPITIGSLSDVSFTVDNLEITALQQDPLDRSRVVPVAMLVPEVALSGASPNYSIGPGGSKNNIVFANREVFPNTVEALMKDPRGLVFQVANYDLTDEMGRNFAYVQQDIADRTVSITIDYGDGRVESHQVATYAGFDENGAPRGVTMDRVLTEDLGLDYEATVDGDIAGAFEVLTRIGDVAADPASSRSWVVFTSSSNGDELDDSVDFGDVVLHSGDVYRLAFLQDQDGDRIFAREEYLAGSDDLDVDSDDDGLTDYEEVRTGWTVRVVGKTPYLGYADPRRDDSDDDGIPDVEEIELGTDARLRDTDGDGLLDGDELNGFWYRRSGDLSDSFFGEPYPGEAWVTDPLDPDTDGDGLGDGFETRIGSDPQVDDAADYVDTDADGLSDAEEESGCAITINGTERDACSSKYEPDTDGDGLPDLLERLVGTDPQRSDGDGDYLSDYDELDVSTFNVIDPTFDAGMFRSACSAARACEYDASGSRLYGSSPRDADEDGDDLTDYDELVQGWRRGTDSARVFSDPRDADPDGDGLDDDEERDHLTDPNDRDTDGDGPLNGNLTDGEEVDAGLDPLVEDQAVRVTMSRIVFGENGDDDALTGDGDYFWSFAIRTPDGGTETFHSANDRQIGDNSTVTIGVTRSFRKTVSQSNFEISGWIYEDDSGDEQCSNTYSQSFGESVTSQTVQFTNGSGGGCEFTVYFDVQLN